MARTSADLAFVGDFVQAMAKGPTLVADGPPVSRPRVAMADDEAAALPERLSRDGLSAGCVLANRQLEVSREVELQRVCVAASGQIQRDDVDWEAVLRQHVSSRKELNEATTSDRRAHAL